jgi:hypothetical protein
MFLFSDTEFEEDGQRNHSPPSAQDERVCDWLGNKCLTEDAQSGSEGHRDFWKPRLVIESRRDVRDLQREHCQDQESL